MAKTTAGFKFSKIFDRPPPTEGAGGLLATFNGPSNPITSPATTGGGNQLPGGINSGDTYHDYSRGDVNFRSPTGNPGEQNPGEGEGTGGTASYNHTPLSPWDANGSGNVGAAVPAPIVRNDIMAPANYQAQARARQQALIDQLHGIATGQLKSPAQDIYEQQVQQAQNQNTSQSSDLRDVGAGGQMHIAQQNANTMSLQGMAGGARLQAQQQQQAESALAQLYEHQRQGDLAGARIGAEGTLGNNNLNDSRNTSAIDRLLGVNIADTNRQGEFARADLGYDTEQQAQNGQTGRMVAEGAGTLFDYLGKAGAGNNNSGDQTSEEHPGKPNSGGN